MKTYKITWRDKSATIKAESARDAIQAYGSRLVFGSHQQFCNLANWNVDADTYGKQSAHAFATNAAGDRYRVSAQAI